MPITGQPYLPARSSTLQIFSATASESEPPKTVDVLGEDEDPPAEDLPVARDDGVAERPALGHPEVRLAMAHEPVELDERPGVAEQLDAFPGEQPARVAARRDRLLGAGVERLRTMLLEPLELGLRRPVPLRLPLRHAWSLTAPQRLDSGDGGGRPLDDLAVRRAG